jgi:hypothetical protein
MTYKWTMLYSAALALLLLMAKPSFSQDRLLVPDQVYEELEYLSSLINSDQALEPSKISSLINFVSAAPADTSLELKVRKNMEGIFHVFQIDSSFEHLLGYVYNPDIPSYITMPSSLQNKHSRTPEFAEALRRLITQADAPPTTIVLRGEENETITPDANTGSYFTYSHDRLVALLPNGSGPVLLSTTMQDEVSEVGRRGCIVGSDGNWDYLYSEKTGLNTLGLGWVHSYMYDAYSVMLYIPDPEKKTVKTAIFKWLNAGWQKINMVKSSHILGGIKRFAAAMKNVLESPDLPEVQEIVDKYRELREKGDEELRRLVAPYLELIASVEDAGSCPSSFINSVASGDYLQQMDSEEIIRILLLEYIKTHIGEQTSKTAAIHSFSTSSRLSPAG